MGNEVMLGRPLGGPLGGALGLRPAASAVSSLPAALPVDVLLVGGGGAGGIIDTPSLAQKGAPGGGAAQVLQATLALSVGTYPVQIGLGAVRGLNHYPNEKSFGGTTKFAGLQAIGGGPAYPAQQGNNSCSGASTGGDAGAFGRPVTGYAGTDGGTDGSTQNWGGSGGGSSGAGLVGSAGVRALGGPGTTSSISGVPVTYARGGDGSLNNDRATATTNPGDGGPGMNTYPVFDASGRNGILIISYETGTQAWTGGTVTQVGNRTIHTLTADGTLTRTA